MEAHPDRIASLRARDGATSPDGDVGSAAPGTAVPGASSAPTVVVADDNPVYRAGIVRALERRDLDVVAELGDGAEALEAIRRLRPAVALLDLRMPHLDGVDVTEQVRRDPELADVRVLILSAEERPEAVRRAHAAGVAGYLPKESTRRQICDAVHAVAQDAAAA